MPIAGGEPGIALNVSLQQARQFAEQTPDGRVSARERRERQDPSELSPQGQRLAAQARALAQVRESIASGSALLDGAENGLEQIEQLLDELRRLSSEAASGELSDQQRAILNDKFQAKLNELDRIANERSFNGQTLLDAERDRFIPVGTDQLAGVKTVDGGTGTFTAPSPIPGTGLRDVRFDGLRLAPPETVANNGFTFADVRPFSLSAIVGSPTPPAPTNPRFTVAGLDIQTTTGTTSAIFRQTGNYPAVTATTTAGSFQIRATRATTVALPALVGTGTARLDLAETFAITFPAPGTTANLALAGEAETDVQLRVGTGTVPSADEITATIGGVTPGALALRDVALRDERGAERAAGLVDEAGERLAFVRANVDGTRQRLSEADDNAREQRDGTLSARNAIGGPPDTTDVSKQVADNIVNQIDLGIGLLGDRRPETVFAGLF